MMLNRTSFRIDEIDAKNKTIIIRSYGAHTVLRISLADVVHDSAIVSNLPSMQASWLGYYYGKLCIAQGDGIPQQQKKNCFSFHTASDGYKILSLDRKGNVTYIDPETEVVYTENPLNICQNEVAIANFDSIQACYIGMLAGINAAKQNSIFYRVDKQKFALRIVK